jgi:hypothetical protein
MLTLTLDSVEWFSMQLLSQLGVHCSLQDSLQARQQAAWLETVAASASFSVAVAATLVKAEAEVLLLAGAVLAKAKVVLAMAEDEVAKANLELGVVNSPSAVL